MRGEKVNVRKTHLSRKRKKGTSAARAAKQAKTLREKTNANDRRCTPTDADRSMVVADTGKGCLMYRLVYVHDDLYVSVCVRLCVCVCVYWCMDN